MDKVYEQAKDVHVRNIYVYTNGEDAYAYSDAACEEKIAADVLSDLFIKGVIINDDGGLFKPTGFVVIEEIGYITYIKPDEQTPTTAVLTTLYSEEYEEQ